jgi:hypothetical protein
VIFQRRCLFLEGVLGLPALIVFVVLFSSSALVIDRPFANMRLR